MSAVNPKRKRVSKKNKVAWRKHTKVSDVEDFLEDQRFEERLGPPLSTISNEQLFHIDVNISSNVKKKDRKQRAEEPLKCFQILQPFTKVPDPIKKRNRVRSKEERQSIFMKSKPLKLKPSLKQVKLKGDTSQVQDIWSEQPTSQIEKEEWFTNDTKRHTLNGLGKLRKTTRASVDKSRSPAIEPPHPGMSYNPSFQDHLDLLKTIAKKETEVIREEKHLHRVTNKMFVKMSPKQFEDWWLQEMSQGLPNTSNQIKEEKEDDDTDNEYHAVNPPTKNSKKTLKQRRKQKEQQQLELQRQQEKKEKRKTSDIHQLKLVKRQLDKLDQRIAVLREKRMKAKKILEKKPKRLGNTKYEEPDLEFNMGHEISGNLRSMKKEGNILNDRFKSLQKRNIIEPTIRRVRKKAKVKMVTKPGHKEDWKKTVAGQV